MSKKSVSIIGLDIVFAGIIVLLVYNYANAPKIVFEIALLILMLGSSIASGALVNGEAKTNIEIKLPVKAEAKEPDKVEQKKEPDKVEQKNEQQTPSIVPSIQQSDTQNNSANNQTITNA